MNQYGMSERKPTCTPLVPKEQLSVATQEEVDKLKLLKVNYCSAIGSINYLSMATSPDLCFAVSSLPQYLENPGVKHWHAFLHVLRYLKGSSNVDLRYKKDGAQGISAWSDTDWGNCCSTRKSVTGYLATFHSGLVLCKTRKQRLVSISTAEAEYKALCDLTSELMWLKKWCAEAQILRLTQPITVWEDNQSCINVANGNCNFNNQRMKHVVIQLHFVKEVIQWSTIKLHYAPSTEMLADFLTKSVNRVSLEKSLEALGILRIVVRGDVKEPDPKRLRSDSP
ncbi:hypothetical protein O181_100775 [Austropuccinia psidii MF-1]|uniref:Reverse transcriptase Ty1/copia-type domain-containing protein n=1 Tax=Austropuccinia psidii MF-1 TaxID=1389203 RepID=A0A9Q3JDA7_9BASI|nr:hypothetical protein [Austropuccinia psidii MF-1]